MLKVHVLATCSHCNGEAYSSTSVVEDSQVVEAALLLVVLSDHDYPLNALVGFKNVRFGYIFFGYLLVLN